MRLFWVLLLLFTLLVVNNSAFACAGATQTRVLPIGLVDDNIIALHLKMNRTDIGPDHVKGERPKEWWWWYVTARLVSFDKATNQINKVYYTDSLAWHHLKFEKEIQSAFLNGLSKAKPLVGFKPFVPESITICNFSFNTTKASIAYSTDSSQLFIVSPSKVRLAAISNQKLLDTNTIFPYWMVGDERYDFESNQLYWLQSMMYYGVGSIRAYTIDGRKLMVIHIGATSDGPPPWDEKYINAEPEFTPENPKFDRLENTTYDEPILWHGDGFDIPIWLN